MFNERSCASSMMMALYSERSGSPCVSASRMPSVISLMNVSELDRSSKRILQPTSRPQPTFSSSAMRLEMESAATRRGWVQPIFASMPSPASRHILGICVVLPEPVSPASTTTWLARMAATMSSLRAVIGRSAGYVTRGTEIRRRSRRATEARACSSRRLRMGSCLSGCSRSLNSRTARAPSRTQSGTMACGSSERSSVTRGSFMTGAEVVAETTAGEEARNGREKAQGRSKSGQSIRRSSTNRASSQIFFTPVCSLTIWKIFSLMNSRDNGRDTVLHQSLIS